MIISGIIKSSLVDYPGLITCVLFVSGCNYNCYYCHNRSLINGDSDILLPKHIEDFLLKRRCLLDGVVLSGGEPTLQPDLLEYIKYLKDLGYKVKLDTNGSEPGIIEKLISLGYCDYYAVDYKAPAAEYAEICRGKAGAERVLETINLLYNAGVDFEVRTTVIPEMDEERLTRMAAELPRVPRYVLNRYRKPEEYLPGDELKIKAAALSAEGIKDISERLKKYQPNIVI